MKVLATLIVLFSSPMALAETNPFAGCERAPSKVTYLNCRISVVDEYLKKEFGAKALKEANKLVNKECSSIGGSIRMAPELRRLAALDCEFNVKLDYYEELAK